MIPIISLFVIMCLSVLITRVLSIILVYAGLSREAALFQA
ncbi:potassium transporter TrkA, partial [PVC group bacterium]|nr:potassium transporter TrkA [PVC group bacterium]